MAASVAEDSAENSGGISAAEFWRCYFDGRVTEMVRVPGEGYRGSFIRAIDTEIGAWPGEEVGFFVRHDELVRYDYETNPRFATATYKNLADALSAVISARLMQRETIPNIAQIRLASELIGLPAAREDASYSELRRSILKALTVCDLNFKVAFDTLRRLRPNDADYRAFNKDGDLDHLHTQRELLLKSFGICFTDAAICRELQAVIDNLGCEYGGTVDLAVWALGRQNHKGSIAYLTNLLGNKALKGSINVIERALQFICSGRQLVPLSSSGAPQTYWLEAQGRLPTTADDWAEYDAKSALWEKRLRCAKEWTTSGEYSDYLEYLRSDEVAPVRFAAKTLSASERQIPAGHFAITVSNGTRLDWLDLKRLFGDAVAALRSTSGLADAVPAFGEQVMPGVVLTLTSAPAFIAWVQKQRTLGRTTLRITVTSTSGQETTIDLSDSKYRKPNADLTIAADLVEAGVKGDVREEWEALMSPLFRSDRIMSRSSIDFLSNRTILRGFSEPREITMAAVGIYPDHALPQFLHELTHHWCFESPIGLAICLLQLEAAKLMLSSERTAAVRERSRDCLVRATVALTMLAPIVEGISLFSEFDQMVTRHGKLVSSPVTLISFLFDLQRKKIAEQLSRRSTSFMGMSQAEYLDGLGTLPIPDTVSMADLLRDAPLFAPPLMRLRLSPAVIDGKVQLLTSPLIFDEDPYLLGYLIIKSAWVRSFSKYWRMFDTDLFQILFRSFIFGDSSLVSLLLDESPFTPTTINELASYIERRVFEFLECPVERFATQLEEQNKDLIFGRRGSMLELEKVPWETDSVRKAAADAVSRKFRRLQQDVKSENEFLFVELASSLISQRTSMCVLSVEAEYELNSEGVMIVLYKGLPVSAMNTKQVDLPKKGQGQFSIHIIPRTARQLCLFNIFEPRLLLHDQISGGLSPAEDVTADTSGLARSINSAEGIMKTYRMCIEEARVNSLVDWDKTIKATRKVALRAYCSLALSHSSDPSTVQEKMTQDGFWSLFDGDTDAVNQLARLSCWSSLCLSRDVQDQLCRGHGFTLADASERLLSLCGRTKFKFFALDNDGRPLSLA